MIFVCVCVCLEYINSQEVQHDLPLIHEWQQLQGEDAPQVIFRIKFLVN